MKTAQIRQTLLRSMIGIITLWLIGWSCAFGQTANIFIFYAPPCYTSSDSITLAVYSSSCGSGDRYIWNGPTGINLNYPDTSLNVIASGTYWVKAFCSSTLYDTIQIQAYNEPITFKITEEACGIKGSVITAEYFYVNYTGLNRQWYFKADSVGATKQPKSSWSTNPNKISPSQPGWYYFEAEFYQASGDTCYRNDSIYIDGLNIEIEETGGVSPFCNASKYFEINVFGYENADDSVAIGSRHFKYKLYHSNELLRTWWGGYRDTLDNLACGTYTLVVQDTLTDCYASVEVVSLDTCSVCCSFESELRYFHHDCSPVLWTKYGDGALAGIDSVHIHWRKKNPTDSLPEEMNVGYQNLDTIMVFEEGWYYATYTLYHEGDSCFVFDSLSVTIASLTATNTTFTSTCLAKYVIEAQLTGLSPWEDTIPIANRIFLYKFYYNGNFVYDYWQGYRDTIAGFPYGSEILIEIYDTATGCSFDKIVFTSQDTCLFCGLDLTASLTCLSDSILTLTATSHPGVGFFELYHDSTLISRDTSLSGVANWTLDNPETGLYRVRYEYPFPTALACTVWDSIMIYPDPSAIAIDFAIIDSSNCALNTQNWVAFIYADSNVTVPDGWYWILPDGTISTADSIYGLVEPTQSYLYRVVLPGCGDTIQRNGMFFSQPIDLRYKCADSLHAAGLYGVLDWPLGLPMDMYYVWTLPNSDTLIRSNLNDTLPITQTGQYRLTVYYDYALPFWPAENCWAFDTLTVTPTPATELTVETKAFYCADRPGQAILHVGGSSGHIRLTVSGWASQLNDSTFIYNSAAGFHSATLYDSVTHCTYTQFFTIADSALKTKLHIINPTCSGVSGKAWLTVDPITPDTVIWYLATDTVVLLGAQVLDTVLLPVGNINQPLKYLAKYAGTCLANAVNFTVGFPVWIPTVERECTPNGLKIWISEIAPGIIGYESGVTPLPTGYDIKWYRLPEGVLVDTGYYFLGGVAGNYKITIQDDYYHCISDIIYNVPIDAVISLEPGVRPPTCNGDPSGQAFVSVYHAEEPLTYYWTNLSGDTISVYPQTGFVAAGTYAIKVIDAAGCSASDTVVVPEFLALSINHVTLLNDTCGARVTVTGGVTPYRYRWKQITRATNGARTGFVIRYFGADSAVYSLPIGDYVVEVADSNGCFTSLDSVKIESPHTGSRKFRICFRFKTTVDTDAIPTPCPDCAPSNPSGSSEVAAQAAADALDSQLSDALTKLKSETAADAAPCLELAGFNDTLRWGYDQRLYHYTLYYYDRAGRLVRTVPPEGVRFVTSRDTFPAHGLVTRYEHNSLSQLLRDESPDGGQTRYLRNFKNLVRFSQNAKQEADSTAAYVKYDDIYRPIETGLLDLAGKGMTFAQLTDSIENDAFPADYTSERTFTVYNTPQIAAGYLGLTQRFLNNRVSYAYTDDGVKTYYSYDPHGNVEWLQHDYAGFGQSRIGYQYDLVSGKVLRVDYNPGRLDQYYHRFRYDEDNRLLCVETSRNNILWDADAQYRYYAHGPLRRVEIGEDGVQGLDYAYTLHGWLKSVNAANQDPNNDPGGDGLPYRRTPRDRFGMALMYYGNDYPGDYNGRLLPSIPNYPDQPFVGLYNGNIAAWFLRQDSLPDPVTAEYYRYDQLNRIVQSLKYAPDGGLMNPMPNRAYRTNYSYDGNGNLLTLSRFGHKPGAQNLMDAFAYHYNRDANGKLLNNKLRHITDTVADSVYKEDLDSQPTDNYRYDPIGNLVKSEKEAIDTILWNIQGKIAEVRVVSDSFATNRHPNIRFIYDTQGNRIAKKLYFSDSLKNKTDWYVRDPQGNILGIYTQNNAGTQLKELSIFGSDRLGTLREDQALNPQRDENKRRTELKFLSYPLFGWYVNFAQQESRSGEYFQSGMLAFWPPMPFRARPVLLGGSGYSALSDTVDLGTVPAFMHLPQGPDSSFYFFYKHVNNTLWYLQTDNPLTHQHSRRAQLASGVWGRRFAVLEDYRPNKPSLLYATKFENNKHYLSYFEVNDTGFKSPVVIDSIFSKDSLQNGELQISKQGDKFAAYIYRNASRDTADIYVWKLSVDGKWVELSKKIPVYGSSDTLGSLEFSHNGNNIYYNDSSNVFRYNLLDDTKTTLSAGKGGIRRTLAADTTYIFLVNTRTILSIDENSWTIDSLPSFDEDNDSVPDIISNGNLTIQPHRILYFPEQYAYRFTGKKSYYLNDHLGNVRVVVSDRKEPIGGSLLDITGFTASILQSADYYPFGMNTPGREYSVGLKARFGYNGKEADPEWHGGAIYDYGFRIYNPRICKFLSVDPLAPKYPFYTPFAFAGNKPIKFIDLDGLELATKAIKLGFSVTLGKVDDQAAKQGIKNLNIGISYFQAVNWQPNHSYGPGLTRLETIYNKYYNPAPTSESSEFFDLIGLGLDVSNPLGIFTRIICSNCNDDFRSEIPNPKPNSFDLLTGQQPAVERVATTDELIAEIRQNVLKNKLFTQGGSTIYNSKHAGKNNPVATDKGYTVPVKANGYPDFTGYLYPGTGNVTIELTGSHSADIAAANSAAGLPGRPSDYTWHHTENVYQANGKVYGVMQLVYSKAHDAARHSGGVQLYKEITKNPNAYP